MRLLAFLLLLAPQSDPVRDLIDRMRSDTPHERNRAYSELQRLGRNAVPALLRVSRDPDTDLGVRARLLLKSIELRESLPPALLRELPGLEDRLALAGGEWTAALLEAVRHGEHGPAHPALRRSHLNALADGALRGAGTREEIVAVCGVVDRFRLHGAIPELRRLLANPSVEVRRIAVSLLSAFRVDGLEEDLPALLEDAELVGCLRSRLQRSKRAALVPVLTKYLASGPTEAREAAGEMLLDFYRPELLPAFLPLLRDPEPSLRRLAIIASERLAAPDFVARMLPLIADPDHSVRERAVQVLNRTEAPGIACFVRPMLKSDDPDTRAAAVQVLWSAGAKECVPDLAALLEDPDPDVRREALLGLRTLSAKDAVPAIRRRLTDPCEELRVQAAEVLLSLAPGEILDLFVSLLRDREAAVRVETLETLRRAGASQAGPEIARLMLDDDEDVRLGALRALRSLRVRDYYADMVSMLTWVDGDESQLAEDILSDSETKDFLPRYRELLEYEDPSVRQKAARLLGALRDRESLDRIGILLEDPSPAVREAAYSAIHRIDGALAVPILARGGADPDNGVRMQVAQLLVESHSSAAVPILATFLRNPATRSNAFRQLRWLNLPDVIAELTPLLELADRDLRSSAVALLAGLESPSVLPLLRKALKDESAEIRGNAIGGFRHREAPEAIPDLVRCLADDNEDVRLNAVQILARQGAREAIPALLALLPDETQLARGAIVEALGELRAPELKPLVPRLLRDFDWRVVRLAIDAAAATDAVETIPQLRELATGDDMDLRDTAAGALLRLGDRSGIDRVFRTGAWDPFSINQAVCPETWNRLRNLPWTAPLRLSPLALWDRVAAEAGLSLDVDPALFPHLRDDDQVFPTRNGVATLLDVLSTVRADACVIFEADRLRVVPRAHAMEYWQDWARRSHP